MKKDLAEVKAYAEAMADSNCTRDTIWPHFLATTRPRSCAERSHLHYLCISKLGPPLLDTS